MQPYECNTSPDHFDPVLVHQKTSKFLVQFVIIYSLLAPSRTPNQFGLFMFFFSHITNALSIVTIITVPNNYFLNIPRNRRPRKRKRKNRGCRIWLLDNWIWRPNQVYYSIKQNDSHIDANNAIKNHTLKFLSHSRPNKQHMNRRKRSLNKTW